MTFVPLGVLLLVVMYIVGGPVAFVNTVSHWAHEMASAVVGWVRYL